MYQRLGTLLAFAALATVSNAAITFSNFTYGPGATTAGFAVGPTITGNSLTWQPASASVGDGLPSRLLTIALTYDAKSDGGAINQILGSVSNTAQGFVSGSGYIGFREDVFELDAAGNEVGAAIGSRTLTATAANPTLPSITIDLSRTVSAIRVKKSFVLFAPDTTAVDFAGLTQVNQSVGTVPEPASMAALGLGALAMLRRRKRA